MSVILFIELAKITYVHVNIVKESCECSSDLDSFPSFHRLSNIFDFTTAGDWDCVAAVERLPALHYSVDFIFVSLGIMGFIVKL